MQTTPIIPHTLREWVYISVTAFLAFLASFLPKLFRPRQSHAEEVKTSTEAAVIASDQVLKLLKEIAYATENIERLRSQRDFWQGRAATEKARADLAEHELDKRIRIGGGNGKD